MPKVNDREIFEVRPWLNDDVQNVERLKELVGEGGDITVEAVTFTENGTYTAPSGKAYSPVTVDVAGGSSDFSTAEVSLLLSNDSPSSSIRVKFPSVGNYDLYSYTQEITDPPEIHLTNVEMIAFFEINKTTPTVIEVPVYNGKCIVPLLSNVSLISATGCTVVEALSLTEFGEELYYLIVSDFVSPVITLGTVI